MGTFHPLLGETPQGFHGWSLGQWEIEFVPVEQSPEQFPNLPAMQKQSLSAAVAKGDPTRMGLG